VTCRNGTTMRLCLYQPEIAGNVGAVMRLAACLDVGLDIVEPTGFAFSDARLKRAGMDYRDRVAMVRHVDWPAFVGAGGRRILMTTKGTTRLHDVGFDAGDTIVLGRESSGVPATVAADCAIAARIPIAPGARSFNLGIAAAIALAEALRQTGGLPQ